MLVHRMFEQAYRYRHAVAKAEMHHLGSFLHSFLTVGVMPGPIRLSFAKPKRVMAVTPSAPIREAPAATREADVHTLGCRMHVPP